jgi:hypothetical protein
MWGWRVNGLIASGAGDDCIRVFDELRDNVSTLPVTLAATFTHVCTCLNYVWVHMFMKIIREWLFVCWCTINSFLCGNQSYLSLELHLLNSKRVIQMLLAFIFLWQGEGLSYEMVLKQEKAHSTDVNCVRWHPKVCAIFHLWHPSSIYESKPCFICCPSVTFHQHVSFDCLLS